MPESTTDQVIDIVLPFAVEADTPRNQDVLIQSIPGCRLRGGLSPTKGVLNEETGVEDVPQSQIIGMGGLPKIPGMQLHVHPGDLEYEIIDPLYDDEELCIRITRFLSRKSPFRVEGQITGVKPTKGTLDPHRMKTLCRELMHIVHAKEGRIVKGECPRLKDIEKLPGNFLLNPGSRVTNTQPVFEHQWDAWVSKLNGIES